MRARCRGPLGERGAPRSRSIGAARRHPQRDWVLRDRVIHRGPRRGPSLVAAAALLVASVAGGRAAAQGELGGPLTPFPPVVLECWSDVRLFQSLSAGTVDYCRTHLRYVPGAIDCYQLFDRVCSVYLPATGEWTELRQPRSRVPFPCPAGPEPPVCRRLDLR